MKFEISHAKYKNLISDIYNTFQLSGNTLFDGRNTLKNIDFLNEKLVVKSFKVPHIINKIAYTFFRDSKAKKSYQNSLKIVPFSPKPIGYVEYFKWGILSNSYYLSENYVYDFTIREVLLDQKFPNKEKIFEAFASFTFELHNGNIEHLDYSPGNILIKEIDGAYEFKIIDVNRMRFKRLPDIERLQNFSKLWAKDEDLYTIIGTYAKLIDMDNDVANEIALTASQKHKDSKNLKKRLKGKRVVD